MVISVIDANHAVVVETRRGFVVFIMVLSHPETVALTHRAPSAMSWLLLTRAYRYRSLVKA